MVITSLTFILVLALVSTQGTFHICANWSASSCDTFRWPVSRSALLPTKIKGTASSFFTRRICSLLKVETKGENVVRSCPLNQQMQQSYYHLPKFINRTETFVFCNGEDAKEAFTRAEVVVTNGCIVLLTCRVENVNLHLLIVQHHLLPIRVCFRWFIVLHKLIDGKKDISQSVRIQCHSISAENSKAIEIEIVRQFPILNALFNSSLLQLCSSRYLLLLTIMKQLPMRIISVC